MRLPRDLTGNELAKALAALGYQITRQTGSHIRLTTARDGEHHVTIPAHNPLKIGTLAAILTDLETHHRISREELLNFLN
ncbi:MAG: type II toxin-antitoxin system HicA family toxin [Desulfuromonadales bacterium]|nr:type II toxin-antitoxin system HicA family toxin [Desulfuromonadales bacterium]